MAIAHHGRRSRWKRIGPVEEEFVMKRFACSIALLALLASPAFSQTYPERTTGTSMDTSTTSTGTTTTTGTTHEMGTTGTTGTTTTTGTTGTSTPTTGTTGTTGTENYNGTSSDMNSTSGANGELPRTASPLPLVMLSGLSALLGGAWLGRRRR
jgi:LPXTG-motif cell wall-anchored protein